MRKWIDNGKNWHEWIGTGDHELSKRKRKNGRKRRRIKIYYWDLSLREHLLAGAYSGVAKTKLKRVKVKNTTDLNAGLSDIANPAMFLRDTFKKMITSFWWFANFAENVPYSSRRKNKGTNRMKTRQWR
jgi:hypothetical protein